MAYSSKAKDFYAGELQGMKDKGIFKEERYIQSPQAASIKVEYPKGAEPKQVLNFCANNYLGLSSHPEVVKAAHEALDSRGYGLSSVRFICGTQDIHNELEEKLSEFLGMEGTCLFPSCMEANAGLFDVVLTPEDAMISDRLVHASIVDGLKLCKAQMFNYKHNSMSHLEEKLQEAQSCRLRMIITDGVFSMDGDIAPLDKICDLADKYDAMVMVDDSHATGFIGKTGRGTHEYHNVMKRVDIITTTFGKGLGGAAGGCVSRPQGDRRDVPAEGPSLSVLQHHAPGSGGRILKVLELLSKSTDRRDKLEKNTKYWREGLTKAGFDLKQGDTPIVPVMLYNAKLAQDIARDLYAEGIYVTGFFFPVVAQGQARIRTQISAGHEMEHLDKALAAFTKIGQKYGILGLKKDEIIAKYGL